MTSFQLQCFISVESHLSFTKAANDCHVVQATVSRQISLLEEEIGVKLFERDSHGVRVTPAGAMLAGYAPVFLEYQKSILSRVRSASASTERTLRIAVGPYEASLLRQPLQNLYQNFPHTRVELSTYTYYVLLTRYRNKVLDMAICNELCLPQMAGYTAYEIFHGNWLIAASREHEIWSCRVYDQQSFTNCTFITLINDQFDGIRSYCYEYLYNPQIIETNFLSTLLELVASGAGIAIVPAFVANDLPDGVIARDILPRPFQQKFYLMAAPEIKGKEIDFLINALQNEVSNSRKDIL